jgi:hypothetical protein
MYKEARIMEAAHRIFSTFSEPPTTRTTISWARAIGKEGSNELSRVVTIFKLDLKQYDVLVLLSLKERDAVRSIGASGVGRLWDSLKRLNERIDGIVLFKSQSYQRTARGI